MAVSFCYILTFRFACEQSKRLLSFYNNNRNKALFCSIAAVGLTSHIMLICITTSHISAHREMLVVVHHQKCPTANLGSYLAGFRQREHTNRFFIELTEAPEAPNCRFVGSCHWDNTGIMECEGCKSTAAMIAGYNHIVMLI